MSDVVSNEQKRDDAVAVSSKAVDAVKPYAPQRFYLETKEFNLSDPVSSNALLTALTALKQGKQVGWQRSYQHPITKMTETKVVTTATPPKDEQKWGPKYVPYSDEIQSKLVQQAIATKNSELAKIVIESMDVISQDQVIKLATNINDGSQLGALTQNIIDFAQKTIVEGHDVERELFEKKLATTISVLSGGVMNEEECKTSAKEMRKEIEDAKPGFATTLLNKIKSIGSKATFKELQNASQEKYTTKIQIKVNDVRAALQKRQAVLTRVVQNPHGGESRSKGGGHEVYST